MNRSATRRELSRVLAAPDTNEAIDAIVRAFWMRAKPVFAPTLPPRRSAQVVDLREWTLGQAARGARPPVR
jgi:hypothetical protein